MDNYTLILCTVFTELQSLNIQAYRPIDECGSQTFKYICLDSLIECLRKVWTNGNFINYLHCMLYMFTPTLYAFYGFCFFNFLHRLPHCAVLLDSSQDIWH
jgi:hypothetical protein